MLRQTRLAAAAEFKQKSRWSKVWPNMHYGAMYLNYSVGRQMPMRGVNWVTRESNRLTNFEGRYASVVADLDVKKNEEELNLPLSDVRWNDHRRIFWVCSFCGSPYRKNVNVRTRYHAGCNRCKTRHASEVLREQLEAGNHARQSLKARYPAIAAQLLDNGKQENISSLSCTSKFMAVWTCQGCGSAYESTIRSRTGETEAGQASLHPHVVGWAAYCPSCRWTRNQAALGQRALAEGQLLGLDLAPTGVSAPSAAGGSSGGKTKGSVSAKAIPRRKKLVV